MDCGTPKQISSVAILIVIVLMSTNTAISCNRKREVSNVVTFLYGRYVNIPQCDAVISRGRLYHEVDSSVLEKGKPLLVYYKELSGCSLCEIGHLYELARLPADSTYSVLVIIKPAQDAGKVIETVQLQQHAFPVLIDLNGAFLESNPFLPQNPKYHTLLLNHEKQVILVGDPLYNEKMMSVFNDARQSFK